MPSKLVALVFPLVLMLFPLGVTAQTSNKPVDAEGHQWWQHAVFYEIYPRSFMDTNNDGIGDLNGIASKLDYLQKLGVDAIWIAPCFPSPLVDFGYDVSDYQNIDKMYGTLADFDSLVKRGHEHGIKIILDFVVNHSSDQHPWFKDSRSSRTSAKRDWFIWRDGKGGHPPNNWQSEFGGSAWQWDPTTKQYYYHYFYIQQPDLNWRNPAVKNAMFDTLAWWYKRGVAGFRLDAVDTLFEDPALRDNPVLPGKNRRGDANMTNQFNTKLEGVHETLQGLRRVGEPYGAVLIGETWTENVEQLKQYYGAHNNELQMPMDLMFTDLKFSAPVFRRHIAGLDAAGGWPVFVISNHDIDRPWNRYGDGKHNDQIAKDMAAIYLTLRGTPIMYYGEELGMQNTDPVRIEDVKDPVGRVNWPANKGRDGERTPMQWNNDRNAGFTGGTPWLPIPESYKTYNVASERKDPNSLLNFYQRLLALRHQNKALLDGRYIALNNSDPNVLSYLRLYQGVATLVLVNMSAEPQKVSLDLSAQGLKSTAKTLLTTQNNLQAGGTLAGISLEPFGVYIGEVTK